MTTVADAAAAGGVRGLAYVDVLDGPRVVASFDPDRAPTIGAMVELLRSVGSLECRLRKGHEVR